MSNRRPHRAKRYPMKGKDRLSRARRSWNMSRIRGKDTTPEKVVRSLLHRMGYRFRLHVRIPIPDSSRRRRGVAATCRKTRGDAAVSLSSIRNGGEGRGEEALGLRSNHRTPRAVSVDILLPKHRTAIFVHGCFWHRHKGCKNCTTPTNRREWWLAKLNGNAARDKLHQAALRKLGWRVIVIWECEIERPNAWRRISSKLARLAPGF